MLQRFGVADLLADHEVGEAVDTVQRIVEDENLQIRRMLRKYESTIEQQRRILYDKRMDLLLDGAPPARLDRIDQRWADYLVTIGELRDGLTWISLGGKDPFPEFIRNATELFEDVMRSTDEDGESGADASAVQRGATWTYIINDHPFGTVTDRLYAGLQRRVRELMRIRQLPNR